MKCEPTKIGIVHSDRRSRAKFALLLGEGSSRSEPGKGTSSATIIDEAFAGFTRIDGPDSGSRMCHPERSEGSLSGTGPRFTDWQPIRQELVANLAIQLNALDRQRAQLARLLHNIDASQLAD